MVIETGRFSGKGSEGDAADPDCRKECDLTVAMFAKHERIYSACCYAKLFGKQGPKPAGIKQRPCAQNLPRGQTRAVQGNHRHEINRIGGYEQNTVEAGGSELACALPDDRSTSGGNRQAGFRTVGGGSSGHYNDGRLSGVGIVACPDPCWTRQRVGVCYIPRFGDRVRLVAVDENDLAKQRPQHKGVGRCRANMTGTDDGDTS